VLFCGCLSWYRTGILHIFCRAFSPAILLTNCGSANLLKQMGNFTRRRTTLVRFWDHRKLSLAWHFAAYKTAARHFILPSSFYRQNGRSPNQPLIILPYHKAKIGQKLCYQLAGLAKCKVWKSGLEPDWSAPNLHTIRVPGLFGRKAAENVLPAV